MPTSLPYCFSPLRLQPDLRQTHLWTPRSAYVVAFANTEPHSLHFRISTPITFGQYQSIIAPMSDNGPLADQFTTPRMQAGSPWHSYSRIMSNEALSTEDSQSTKTTKPWYKKWWIWVIVAVVVISGIGSLGGEKEDEKEIAEPVAQSEEAVEEEVEETPQSLPPAPDQIGKLLNIAVANLELDGYEVEYVSDSGKGVWDTGNWEVTEQKQNKNQVLLTVTSTTATKSEDPDTPATTSEETTTEEETTSQGLTAITARYACANVWETALKNDYPASKVKIHTIMGVLAETLDDDDSWFIKLEASVDRNRLNIECSVYGSEISPEVVPLAVY